MALEAPRGYVPYCVDSELLPTPFSVPPPLTLLPIVGLGVWCEGIASYYPSQFP